MQVEGHKSSLEPGERWANFLQKTAAALGGLLLASAVICWIAANWQHASGLHKLAVVQLSLIALVLATCRLVYVHGGPKDQNWSVTSLTCALAAVATGGLLALIGQIYHTRVDSWQLFFWWAVLLLPWLLAMRGIFLGLLLAGLLNVAAVQYLDRWAADAWLQASVLLLVLNISMLALWEVAVAWFDDRWRIGPRALGSVAVAWLVVAALAGIDSDIGALGVSAPGLMVAALMLRIYSGKRRDSAMVTLAVLAAFLMLAIPAVAAVESEASLLAVIFGLLLLSGLCLHGLKSAARGGRAQGPTPDQTQTVKAEPTPDAWHVVLFRLAALGLTAGLVIAFLTTVLDLEFKELWHVGLLMCAAGVLVMHGSRWLLPRELGMTLIAAGLLLTGASVYSLDALPALARAVGLLALGVLLYVAAPNAALRWLIAFFVLALASLLTWPEHARYDVFDASGRDRVWVYFPVYFRLWWFAVAAVVALVVGSRRRAAAFWAPLAWALTVLAQATAWLAPAPGIGRLGDAWLQAPELIIIWLACALLPPVALWALLWRVRGLPSGLRLAAPFALAVASVGWMGAPGVGMALLWLILGHALARKSLIIFGVLSMLAYLARFYYQLDSSLLEKAMILGATGLWLLAAWQWLRMGVRESGVNPRQAAVREAGTESAPGAAAVSAGRSRKWQATGLLTGLLLVLLAANMQVYKYENILTSGKSVVLELAPVDPRSLMQGDYMALRFAVAGGVAETLRAAPSELARELTKRGGGYLLLASDGDGVHRLQSVVADRQAATKYSGTVQSLPLATQTALAFDWRDERAHIVTDAWYFPEGQARRYEGARYGELRVGADGTGLLLRLLDEHRRPLP